MLQQSPIMAFVATNDGERAKAFYSDTLGLSLQEDTPFAIVYEVRGTTIRVQKTKGHTPAPHTVLGFDVTDIAGEVRALTAKGVRFERFPGMEQDELGIWRAPSQTRVAWFKDPDGNVISLSQAP